MSVSVRPAAVCNQINIMYPRHRLRHLTCHDGIIRFAAGVSYAGLPNERSLSSPAFWKL